MGSWAAIARAEAAPPPTALQSPDTRPGVIVLDANAVISGIGLLNLAIGTNRVVTTPEVLREVKDKRSRETVAALPLKIETQEPAEESVNAIIKFARCTGDLHALSSADVRLLGLAHTIETSYYGNEHLRTVPLPAAQVKRRQSTFSKSLPGWGVEGGDWTELDRLNQQEEEEEEEEGRGKCEEGITVSQQGDMLAQDVTDQEKGFDGTDKDAVEMMKALSIESEEGSWEVAARTRNVARRQRRRELRRMEGEAAIESVDTVDTTNSTNSITEAAEINETSENEQTDVEEPERAHPSPTGSAVRCVTGDFAMQNVLLQMGLSLAAPDGKVITSISRWVLRCSACFQTTKDVGRIFCPRCGNMTMDRVKVVVGPDGSEQYGVRKKHILRGTKFSIPKPKGGRSNDVILREDQLLTKKHLLRARRAAQRAESQQPDPFAPEYGEDTWHQAASLPGGQRGAAAMLAGWKHNPNERKHYATNRRRK